MTLAFRRHFQSLLFSSLITGFFFPYVPAHFSIAKRKIVIKLKVIFKASGDAFYWWFLTLWRDLPSLPILRPMNDRNFGWQQRLLYQLLPMQVFICVGAGSFRRAFTKRALQGNTADKPRATAELWKSWALYPNSAAWFLMKPQLYSSHIVQKADCVSSSPSTLWNWMIPWHLIGSFPKAKERFIKTFGWLSFQKKVYSELWNWATIGQKPLWC